MEAEGSEHGRTTVLCDRTAVDAYEARTEQERSRAQSWREYEAWKRDRPADRAGGAVSGH